MALTQTLTDSFKGETLLGVHDFRASGGDTFYIALYTSAATLDETTTAYTTTNEISGTGYAAGGVALTNSGVTVSNGVAYTTFSTASWPSASFSARGALIYNTTPSALDGAGATLVNPAVCILDFGSTKVVTSNTFAVIFPAADSTNAIIRLN